MKAIMASRYGPPEVLLVKDVVSRQPRDGEVLIRVGATIVAASDCAMRKGEPAIARLFMGLTRPSHVFGDVFAGTVESVGKNVHLFNVGDEVFGSSGNTLGTNAEYLTLNENEAIAPKPAGISFGEAAAISEGSLTALPFLRDHGKVKQGSRVLINGASGGVGVYAVQIAKYLGAHVTGVSGAANLAFVQSLGVDRAVDYSREDFALSGETYDVIFDAVGRSSFSRCRRALSPRGVYLTTVPTADSIFRTAITSFSGGKRAVFAATGLRKPSEKKHDLEFISGLIEAGSLKPVVGREYCMSEIVEAHRHVETGHKRGSLVVNIS